MYRGCVFSTAARGSNPNHGPLLHVMPPLSLVGKEFWLQPVAEFRLKLLKMLTITSQKPSYLQQQLLRLASNYLKMANGCNSPFMSTAVAAGVQMSAAAGAMLSNMMYSAFYISLSDRDLMQRWRLALSLYNVTLKRRFEVPKFGTDWFLLNQYLVPT